MRMPPEASTSLTAPTARPPAAMPDAPPPDLAQRPRPSALADATALLLISLLWLLPLTVIGYRGGFPLNDDWAYTYSVKHFLDHGKLWRTDWTYIPLITHTLIGAAFSKIFGFSFETLRLSTLFMGWLGLIGAYTLCRAVGASVLLAAFATFVVAFNPIYLNLSYTFMTDVPFVALTVWSIALFLIGMQRWSYPLLAAGVGLGIAATLSRQFGLAVAGAFALTLITTDPKNLRRWVAAVAILALNLAIHFGLPPLVYGYLHTIKSDSWMTSAAVSSAQESSSFTRNAVFGPLYLGLFLLPLSLVLAMRWVASHRWTLLAAAAATAVLLAAVLLAARWRLPRYNMIYDLGLGPIVIGVETVLREDRALLWWPVTILAAASLCTLLVAVVACAFAQRRDLLRSEFLLPATAAAAYAPVMLLFGMDRYLLPLIPLLAACVVIIVLNSNASRSRLAFVPGALVLALFAAFSICGTRDYLTRHRTNWALLSDLMSTRVTPDRINGGFEFNCWHNFGTDPKKVAWTKGNWVIDDEYLISYKPNLAGYAAVESRSYPRLVPPGTETVTLYRRNVP